MIDMNTVLGSFQKWAIGNDLRTILLEDGKVQALVGDHIYPCIAPESTEGNFIVYKREKYSKLTAHQGVYEDDCQVSMTVIADNYDESVEIAAAIDNALTRQHMVQDKYRVRMILENSTEGFEDNKYYQVLLFSIK